MMKVHEIPVAEIYIPTARRKTLDDEKLETLTEAILEEGHKVPIMVRPDKKKNFILVEGLHRLEACRALGDETINCYLVQARKH
ncbi:ParB N-terminal domain-containing protein [Rhodovibrionaceae bacterium A322]